MLARQLRTRDDIKSKKLKKVRKVKNKKNKKFTYFMLSLVFLGICLVTISGYTKLTSIRNEITDIEREKELLIREKMNLEARLEGIKSSEEISEEAMVKLGMTYPEPGQIIYVTLKDDLQGKNTNRVVQGLKKFTDKTLKLLGR